ncbi:MAG: PTS sugar transporter subunit IIA [Spirochaetales bacterium]|nr:PTS sugar transporter subunit IIA [Spirochaetales bacterium]
MTNKDKIGQTVSMEDELLTLSEVSLYLKVAEKTILRMIRRGEIPCVRIGGQWRFLRSMLENWIYSNMKGVKEKGFLHLIEDYRSIVQISRLTKNEFILIDIKPGSKEQIITQLVQPLVTSNIILKPHSYVKKIILREQMASTAIGPGVAFPHLRHPEENTCKQPVIIFGLCIEGTDFIALDGKKTYIFCLLCIQSVVIHLRMLSGLLNIFRREGAVEMLRESKTREDFLNTLLSLEQKCPRHDSNV